MLKKQGDNCLIFIFQKNLEVLNSSENINIIEFLIGKKIKEENYEEITYDGKIFYVKKEPIITDKDIEKIEVEETEFTIILNKDGKKKFCKVTDENIGNYILISVKGKIIVCAEIKEKIDSERITVQKELSKEEKEILKNQERG